MVATFIDRIKYFTQSKHIFIALLLLHLILYGHSLLLPLFSDDYGAWYNATLLNWNDIFTLKIRQGAYIIYKIIFLLFGKNSFCIHLFSILIHTINCFLIYRLAHLLSKTLKVDSSMAWISCIFYCIYHSHHESVIWLVGLPSMLNTTLAMMILIMALNNKNKYALFCIVLLSCIALYIYENVFMIPFIAIGFLYFNIHFRKYEKLIFSISFLFIYVIFINLLYTQIHEGNIQLDTGYYKVDWTAYQWYIMTHLRLLFRTILLCHDILPVSISVILSGFIIMLLLYYNLRNLKILVLLSIPLLLSLTPAGLVPASYYTMEGARFTYVPSLFLCMIIAYLVITIYPYKKVFNSICICIAIYFIYGNIMGNIYWHQAGQWSKRLVCAIQEEINENNILYLLSTVDNHHGAYLCRNNFNQMLEFYLNDTLSIRKIKPLSHVKDFNIVNRNFMEITYTEKEIIYGNIKLLSHTDTTQYSNDNHNIYIDTNSCILFAPMSNIYFTKNIGGKFSKIASKY